MPRYFKPIAIEDFKTKLRKAIVKYFVGDTYNNWNDESDNFDSVVAYAIMNGFNDKIHGDISKIQFDLENCHYEGDNEDQRKIMGFHTLGNGMPFLGLQGGGDWEYPVFFIVYWDGKTFRGYVPEHGNTYSKKWKCAYGSEHDAKGYEGDYDEPDWGNLDKEFDSSLIIYDIMYRVQIKG